MDAVLPLLPADASEGLRQVPQLLDRDPLTVLAVAALIHVHDQLAWGIAPAPCQREAAASQGAQIAVAVAADMIAGIIFTTRWPNIAPSPGVMTPPSSCRSRWAWVMRRNGIGSMKCWRRSTQGLEKNHLEKSS